ncbi:MAG TPA: glutamine synthetase III [Spirochaetia bacterium]|nr:glutamine synthetase III [Spirochaetia bacterium]
MQHTVIDFEKTPLTEIYGVNAFSDAIMRERLPKTIYTEMKRVQAGEIELSRNVAEVVANAMKDWAIEKGATHFTHWFQPLTGLTAEKHDSFISPTPDGKVIMEFSGKELVKGEPDASSFPSGGLRSTFEARGYTAWDTTSPAFLKEDKTGITLYIPTAFVSYRGEALDKKVPLLRSMEALSRQAMRVLKALGNTTSRRVITTVGPEQEYFLVDKTLWEKRLDLVLTGRTLFGSMAPKGQEMGDHYFGSIKERVSDFMRELNYELWKLGISAKTQHNEVAPNQFEIATIYDTSNIACDRNQLVMDTLKKVANRHGLVALLHEKPFAGINGSGKHNNWSMATDDGINLLEPGESPAENAQFLLFLSAVITAVDEYAPILRMSTANAGNDHRLGAHEAPPAIISVFLGDQLSDILEKLSKKVPVTSCNGRTLEIGVTCLPRLPRDMTDRNRTSPFAFTGNKFEFRMVPSSHSVASPNAVLNSVVADILSDFADKLESSTDINACISDLVTSSYTNHKRVVFNGNNYSEEWIKEAEQRGLPNIKTSVEAYKELINPKAVKMFARHKVFTREELESRYAIYLENYSKQINIEANVMVEMANRQIFPAVTQYAKKLADMITSVKAAIPNAGTLPQEALLKRILSLIKGLKEKADILESAVHEAHDMEGDEYTQATAYRESVFKKMADLRKIADELETITDKALWPFPGYEDLLFGL